MFKLEVSVNGEIKHHYWMNRHKDDFIQFLPRQFTAMYGEEILPEHLTIYMIDEDKQPLLEGKLKQHESNGLAYALGKIKVIRKDKAKYKVGDKVKLEDYQTEALLRDEKFEKAKEKHKVKDPKSKKEDWTNPDGSITSDVDVVTIDETESLALDMESLEMDLTGVQVSSYPYDKNGKFLGNK